MPKVTTLVLDEVSIKEGRILAAVQGVSLSALMREMIHDRFKKYEKSALERNTLY